MMSINKLQKNILVLLLGVVSVQYTQAAEVQAQLAELDTLGRHFTFVTKKLMSNIVSLPKTQRVVEALQQRCISEPNFCAQPMIDSLSKEIEATKKRIPFLAKLMRDQAVNTVKIIDNMAAVLETRIASELSQGRGTQALEAMMNKIKAMRQMFQSKLQEAETPVPTEAEIQEIEF